MNTVLFACTHNAGRSQIAAAFFNAFADPSRAHAISAGTAPAPRIHPVVADAMRERGIDLKAQNPRLLTADLAKGANLLVTMGCGEACPFVPGLETVDWELPDPKDRPLEEVRTIRDTIEQRVRTLLAERGWTAANDKPPLQA